MQTHSHQRARAKYASLRGIFALLMSGLVVVGPGCTSPREWIANGFRVGPEYCRPGAPISQDWIDGEDKRVIHDPVDHAAWWTTFNDPVLNQLVAEAYRQNLTLRQAGARIMEARALRAIAAGNFFPQQQDFAANYSYGKSSGDPGFSPEPPSGNWSGSFNLAWELDFWGRYRRAVEAADADLDATIFDYGDVVVTLVADVAATYIDIRTLQARLELVKQNVINQRKTYELTETRFRLGQSSEIDVQQAKSSLAQTEAFVPQLEIALRQAQNELCVLLGVPVVDLTERLGEGHIPTISPDIVVGIPAELLMRRPDVRRAERDLAAQSARIGIAETDLYPQITLTGDVGVRAGRLDQLFDDSASFASVSPGLRWNIFNYGRILNNIDAERAQFDQFLAVYRQSVLLANLEAENAVVDFLRSQERLEWQLQAAEAAGRTNELINELLIEGEADFNRVFNVQNFKTQQEENAAVAKGQVAQSLISIYRALGGGWPSPFLGEAILEVQPPFEPGAEPAEPEQPEALPAPDAPPEFPAAAGEG